MPPPTPDDRAVVLLGDPSDPHQRGVEVGRGTFHSWTRAAWGKRTRQEQARHALPEMGQLFAIVETEAGELVEIAPGVTVTGEMVEPARVRFVDRRSKLQYPTC